MRFAHVGVALIPLSGNCAHSGLWRVFAGPLQGLSRAGAHVPGVIHIEVGMQPASNQGHNVFRGCSTNGERVGVWIVDRESHATHIEHHREALEFKSKRWVPDLNEERPG